jgi:hypothetical protein
MSVCVVRCPSREPCPSFYSPKKGPLHDEENKGYKAKEGLEEIPLLASTLSSIGHSASPPLGARERRTLLLFHLALRTNHNRGLSFWLMLWPD